MLFIHSLLYNTGKNVFQNKAYVRSKVPQSVDGFTRTVAGQHLSIASWMFVSPYSIFFVRHFILRVNVKIMYQSIHQLISIFKLFLFLLLITFS